MKKIHTKKKKYFILIDCSKSDSISFTVNTAPRSGICNVTPKNGTALIDRFNVTCINWFDNQILKYYFIHSNIPYLGKNMLPIYNKNNFKSFIFSSGNQYIQPVIMDSLGGFVCDNTLTVNVFSLINANTSVSDLLTVFNSNNSGNTNISSELAGVYADTLNEFLTQNGKLLAVCVFICVLCICLSMCCDCKESRWEITKQGETRAHKLKIWLTLRNEKK